MLLSKRHVQDLLVFTGDGVTDNSNAAPSFPAPPPPPPPGPGLLPTVRLSTEVRFKFCAMFHQFVVSSDFL